MIASKAFVDKLCETWTWLAEETGRAVSCDSLNKDTATPLPFATPYPGQGDRRGQDVEGNIHGPRQNNETRCPLHMTAFKKATAFGSLMPAICRAKNAIGKHGRHCDGRKPRRGISQLGAVPL